MSKDLLDKALEASGKKVDDIFGDSEEPKRTITYNEKGIYVKEVIEGKEMIAKYTDLNKCMSCNKERLIASQTGACPICDEVMTLEAYEDYVSEYVEYFKDKGTEDLPKQKEKSRFDNLTSKEREYFDLILENTDKDGYWIVSMMDDKKAELGLISNEGVLMIIIKELGLQFPKQEVKDLPKTEGFIGKIIEETGLSKKEILEMVEEKKVELKGLISQEGALFIIGKELGIDLQFPKETQQEESIEDIFGDSPKPKELPKIEESKEVLKVMKEIKNPNKEASKDEKTLEVFETKKAKIPPKIPSPSEITKRQADLDPNKEEVIDFALVLKEAPQQTNLELPSKEEIDYKVSLIEYIKQSVVFKEDYGEMFGEPYLRASGYDKFIHYFKLNVKYPIRDAYEDKDGWHCDVTCEINAPWGQTVEGYGGASMDTMTIKKTRHNMKALADTRAKTRAVRCIMGFSKPSYEEMLGSDVDEIFGGK